MPIQLDGDDDDDDWFFFFVAGDPRRAGKSSVAVFHPVAGRCRAVGAYHGAVSSGGALVSSQRLGAVPHRRTHRPVEITAAAAATTAALRVYKISGLSDSSVRAAGRRTHRTAGVAIDSSARISRWLASAMTDSPK